MAKAPFLLPTVFVGCPYGKRFKFKAFRKTLDSLPIAWYYADTSLKTKHLLEILATYVKAVDYCIFDLSLWNPNVALELGLTEGMGKEYFIFVNKSQSKDVPSDLKGMQRIDYSSPKGFKEDSLFVNIAKYLVKDQTHPRRVWNKLASPNRDKKFYLALMILAHFRDNQRLKPSEVKRLSRGLYLKKKVQSEVMDVLEDSGLISAKSSALGAKLKKRLYPPTLHID
jgi:hypothetical protein